MADSLSSKLKKQYQTMDVPSPTADEMTPQNYIAPPTASELTPPLRPEDVYAQDPATRMRALAQSEPIKDASGPLVANAMMLASPAGAPVSNYINTIKSLMDLHHVVSSGALSTNSIGSSAYFV